MIFVDFYEVKKYSNEWLGRWKCPGGQVDTGETLGEAVVREIFEETGIKSEFEGILSFSEFSRTKFGKNDLYFLCLVRPTSFEINACENEIADCQWMDVEEYTVPHEKDLPFYRKLKQMVSFISTAKSDPNFDASELIKEGDPSKLFQMECLKQEFKIGKKGRTRKYSLNYPYFLQYWKTPKL